MWKGVFQLPSGVLLGDPRLDIPTMHVLYESLIVVLLMNADFFD